MPSRPSRSFAATCCEYTVGASGAAAFRAISIPIPRPRSAVEVAQTKPTVAAATSTRTIEAATAPTTRTIFCQSKTVCYAIPPSTARLDGQRVVVVPRTALPDPDPNLSLSTPDARNRRTRHYASGWNVGGWRYAP